jgi:membrane protease YdiL (CAAX protease family)
MPSVNANEASRGTDWHSVHAVVFVALFTVTTCVPIFRPWPLFWLIPLGAYAVLVTMARPLRTTFRRWRFGRVSTRSAVATLVIALGSCAILTEFHRTMHPDVRAYGAFLPVSTLGGVVVAGVVFSVFNALLEEIVFRGIFYDAIQSQWGAPVAVIATAFIFGCGHLHGYPPGPSGSVLAGAYGLCLGWLRFFTRGIGLPSIAHIAADATIFILVAHSGVW